MQFYSNAEPNLIGSIVRKTIYKVIKKKSNNSTISDKISNMMDDFYKKYICDCKLIVLVLAAIFVMLLCRYYDKQNKKDQTKVTTYSKPKSKEEEDLYIELGIDNDEYTSENLTNKKDNILSNNIHDQTSHLKYNSQPSFNNLQSVNSQFDSVEYIPNSTPINIPGLGFVPDKSLYPYSKPYENLNNPNYNYADVYKNPSRSYYNGTYDTYDNAQDTNIMNPLGFSNDFNSTTGNFIGGMTAANKQNIIDYKQLLDNTNSDLLNSVGPNSINLSDFETTMVPPYASN